MRNSIKFLFLMLGCMSIVTQESMAHPIRVQKALSVAKNAGKIGAAMGIALAMHIVTELPIIVGHEYGHGIGNRITGGKGGKVSVECNLHKHPLAIFMPFFAEWVDAKEYGNESVWTASGPVTGIAINYAIMAMANGLYALTKGSSIKNAVKEGCASPVLAHKALSDEIADCITKGSEYKLRSCADIAMLTFTLLKSGKMFGEFVYGLTPVSIEGGDGHYLWQNMGLKKDCTVHPFVGLSISMMPFYTSIATGIAKGVHQRFKLKAGKTMHETIEKVQ